MDELGGKRRERDDVDDGGGGGSFLQSIVRVTHVVYHCIIYEARCTLLQYYYLHKVQHCSEYWTSSVAEYLQFHNFRAAAAAVVADVAANSIKYKEPKKRFSSS